jgi:hypothetical protein
MRKLSLLVFVAALVNGAAPVAAQQPAQPSKPRTPAPGGDECTTVEPGRIECRRVLDGQMSGAMGIRRLDSAMMKRAALGMQLSATGSARDTLGVFVAAVTPKGPAENAGIVEGDRIVSINGVDLRVAPGDVEDGYASGLPSHRLSREVGKLTPGATVNLRVYSGGRVRDVQVIAGRASDLMRSRFFGNIGGDGPDNVFIYRDGMPEMPPMPPRASMPSMRGMRMMPGMDGMGGFELRNLLRMRMMEGGFGQMIPSGIMSPRATVRIRTPYEVRTLSPERLRVEKIQKAKEDSLKKVPRR